MEHDEWPAAVLPGEGVVEDELVRTAVAHINGIKRAAGLEAALAIGEYLLGTFFGGDLEAFHERQGAHLSYRALQRQADLEVSASSLWYSVALIEHLQLLPGEMKERLSLSHHRLLVGVKDVEQRRALAQRAAEEGLSRRALEREVQRLHVARGERRTGRPRLPAVVKAARRIDKAIELAGEELVDGALIARWGADRSAELLGVIEGQIAALEGIRSRLEEALGDAS